MKKMHKVMKKEDLTVTKIGLALGVNPSLISQVMAGQRYVYPKLRRGIAEILKTPENELFTPEGWLK